MKVENFEWETELIQDREFKSVSPTKLRNFGLKSDSATVVSDLEELRTNPPNIIIAEATEDLRFTQNYATEQELKKKNKYVMGLGVFQQLFCNPQSSKKKYLKPSSIKFKNIYRPYIGQDLTDKSLLIFRTGGIGDLLFIQPNLIYLKDKYPTCKILFACGPQYQSMVETWDCVDEVLDLPFSAKVLIESDYHALFEGVIERCKLAETANAYNLFSEWMGLSLPDEYLLPRQEPKEDKVEFCKEKLDKWNLKGKDFIVMQLRASSPIRTPRPQFWIKIVDELTDRGYKIVLTDNPRQSVYVNEFIKLCKNQDKVFNFCKHSLTLDYSIALISLAKGVIATDSALNHIAASMDVACYGIYGPFPGKIRLKTYPKSKWIDAQRECAPCFIHSPRPCPRAHKDKFSPCYDNIDIEKIIPEIEELFK